jgi:hypothetical protein
MTPTKTLFGTAEAVPFPQKLPENLRKNLPKT